MVSSIYQIFTCIIAINSYQIPKGQVQYYVFYFAYIDEAQNSHMALPLREGITNQTPWILIQPRLLSAL